MGILKKGRKQAVDSDLLIFFGNESGGRECDRTTVSSLQGLEMRPGELIWRKGFQPSLVNDLICIL